MRFGTWNVRSLYRVGSLMIVSRELARYKLDLVGVQEVRWEGSGTEPAGEYTFLYGKGNENHGLGTGFFVHRESYPMLRGVPVPTAWRVIGLRMEERPPDMEVSCEYIE
jgi:exonuclease III